MAANGYEKLYSDMKNDFTVEYNGKDYSLGDYMRMKAGEKAEKAETLPVAVERPAASVVLRNFFEDINEKLTVRTPPVKDRTMRAFPRRTAFSAILSGACVCALLFSFAIAGLFGAKTTENLAYNEVEIEDCESVEINL